MPRGLDPALRVHALDRAGLLVGIFGVLQAGVFTGMIVHP